MGFSESAKASSGGGGYSPVPAGTHQAVCYSVIDLGTQEYEYQGEHKKAHKVMMTFEIPEERIDIDGESKPRVISKEYTASFHEKANLRKDIGSWFSGKFPDGDLGNLLKNHIIGKVCLISVIMRESKSSGKEYANLASISPLPKGMKEVKGELPVVYFEMGAKWDKATQEVFSDITPWIQDKIKNSPEYAMLNRDTFEETAPKDDLPF